MSTETTAVPTAEELAALVGIDPQQCDLYDPPPGVDATRGWSGDGVRCQEPAEQHWRLLCPDHGPLEVWVCRHHAKAAQRGEYSLACGPHKLRWERC